MKDAYGSQEVMKSKALLLLGLLSCLSLMADNASAQDEPQAPGQDYELGVGYVSDDAFLFGRYNGLQEQGPYLIGDINAQDYVGEEGKYWRARGTRLGLDSRYLRLEGGFQGSQQYFFEYDQLPNNMSDSASTPYRGVGGSSLRLPAGFDINTDLDSALRPFDIETERKRIGVGGSFFPRKHWQLDVGFQHETRDGIERIGGAIAGTPGGGGNGPGGPGDGGNGPGGGGGNGPGGGGAGGGTGGGGNTSTLITTTSAVVSAAANGHGGGAGSGNGHGSGNGFIGNTSAALLPEPIDYQTNLLDMTLHYAKDKAQLDLSYHLSLFDNDKSALAWQDPFAPAELGSQSLAPDNQFHQLSLTGGYLLPYNSHLTGVVSVGRMTQDEDFQPYTVNPSITTAALPRSSLDGEVWLTTAQLRLVSSPMSRLRLSAAYRFDDRDNDTQVNSYDYVVADSFTGNPVENNPLSYKRNQVDLTANYRINSGMSLRGGYSYDGMSRDYGDAESNKTDDNTVFARWKMQPHTKVGIALYAERGKRNSSSYQTPEGENPALRAYYLADRDRTQLGTTVDYMATDRLSFAATAEYNKDDYPDTEIGLTETKDPSYTLDVSYQPRSNVTTYGYYTHEDLKSTQAGSETGATSPDWEADFDDTADTLGVGVKVTGIRNKWDVGADLVYTRAKGEIKMKDLTFPGTNSDYPDLETRLTSLKLWTQYQYRRNLAFKLSYWYQDYSADNWAVDNLQENSINNLLLLGEDTQDYDVHVVGLSFVYKFD